MKYTKTYHSLSFNEWSILLKPKFDFAKKQKVVANLKVIKISISLCIDILAKTGRIQPAIHDSPIYKCNGQLSIEISQGLKNKPINVH